MLFDDIDPHDDEDDGAASPLAPDAPAGLQPPRLSTLMLHHDAIEAQLAQMQRDNKMPHALIFSGLQGIGKATMAFRLARSLLKSGTGAQDSTASLFGEPAEPSSDLSVDADDRVFRRVASGGHPDLLVIERPYDEKKGRFKGAIDVDSVRKVVPFMRMTAADGGWRVVIVDDADTMGRAAQNALLKILEEPPDNAVLILVCHRLGALIPTIRSRSRVIPFQPLPDDTVLTLLHRATDAPAGQDSVLLALSQGSAGQAITLAQDIGTTLLDDIVTLAGAYPRFDWVAVHLLAERLATPGQETMLNGFQTLTLWLFRELLQKKIGRPSPYLDRIVPAEAFDSWLRNAPLESWIKICDSLQTHFDKADHANLDRRHIVTGVFMILESF